MARCIALLRAVNLGERGRVGMGDLRKLLTELGYGDVRTYLRSGNVVLSSEAPPDRLGSELQQAIAAELEVDTPVVVRTRDELAGVVHRDPFGDLATDPRRYQVTFLSAEPEPEIVRELEAADLAPERVVAAGREIYAWHPDGIGRSRLAALLTDRKLGVTATARNWTTVTKLLALADE